MLYHISTQNKKIQELYVSANESQTIDRVFRYLGIYSFFINLFIEMNEFT